MITRLANLWDRLMGSFWFLPTLMLIATMLLGGLLPVFENKSWIRVRGGDWLHTTPAGARNVLSVIAGAMITVAGVVFSITMVTLSIASSQFGSRVLRHQLRDRATQMALGAFLGTTVYCLFASSCRRGRPECVCTASLGARRYRPGCCEWSHRLGQLAAEYQTQIVCLK